MFASLLPRDRFCFSSEARVYDSIACVSVSPSSDSLHSDSPFRHGSHFQNHSMRPANASLSGKAWWSAMGRGVSSARTPFQAVSVGTSRQLGLYHLTPSGHVLFAEAKKSTSDCQYFVKARTTWIYGLSDLALLFDITPEVLRSYNPDVGFFDVGRDVYIPIRNEQVANGRCFLREQAGFTWAWNDLFPGFDATAVASTGLASRVYELPLAMPRENEPMSFAFAEPSAFSRGATNYRQLNALSTLPLTTADSMGERLSFSPLGLTASGGLAAINALSLGRRFLPFLVGQSPRLAERAAVLGLHLKSVYFLGPVLNRLIHLPAGKQALLALAALMFDNPEQIRKALLLFEQDPQACLEYFLNEFKDIPPSHAVLIGLSTVFLAVVLRYWPNAFNKIGLTEFTQFLKTWEEIFGVVVDTIFTYGLWKTNWDLHETTLELGSLEERRAAEEIPEEEFRSRTDELSQTWAARAALLGIMAFFSNGSTLISLKNDVAGKIACLFDDTIVPVHEWISPDDVSVAEINH